MRRLDAVRLDSVPRWGRMSAHQMVCHLGDALLMAMGLKPVSPASGLLQRTVLKWIVLYTPLPWPKGILTSPEIDQLKGGTQPVDFAADVRQLALLLERFSTGERGRADGQMHPIFGRMSAAAWLRWGYLHMDHHLRQFGV
jgi:hypothetical protein